MFPDDVKKMTALDPELSAAPLTVKLKFCKQTPGTLWKLAEEEILSFRQSHS